MSKRNVNSYTSGTSALVMPRWVQSPDEANIIAFPGSLRTVRASESLPTEPAGQCYRKQSRIRRIADSSEMLCSLRFESMLGCPYHLFTRQGIAALSTGAAIIGIVSLILGS